MEETKIQELALDDNPVMVSRAGQMPKGFRLAKPANFSSISENEYEIYPSGGDIGYTADKHILYDISVADDRMRFIYGPATYQSFLVTNATSACRLDSTANCYFREMRLSGASLLEQCDNVHVLNNILLDCTVSADDRKRYYSFMGAGSAYGSGDNNTAWSYTDANLAAGAVGKTSFTNNTVREGLYLSVGTQDNYNKAYLISLIPSGLIGCFQNKLFPISECKKSLKLDFKLESNALATIGGGTFTLSNCRIKMCVIELNDILTDAVRRIYDSIYIIPYTSWSQYSYTLQTGAQNGTINISCGLKYLKGVIACFRANNLLVAAERSLSTRARMGMIEYRWSVNGKSYPSDSPIYLAENPGELLNNGNGTIITAYVAPAIGPPVVVEVPSVNAQLDDARGFMQVMKLFNNMPSTHATCSFDIREFNANGLLVRAGNAGADASGKGAFLAAVNLELPNAEEEYRTTTDSTSNNIIFKYRLNTGLLQNVYCDFYLWYDAEAVVENGVVTANF